MPRIVKGKAFHLRLEDALKQEVDSMCEETGVEAAPLVRALLKATLSFYKAEGYLHLPLDVFPANSAASFALRVAERPAFAGKPGRVRSQVAPRRRKEKQYAPTTATPPQNE